jgi:molecular chaperone HtpG
MRPHVTKEHRMINDNDSFDIGIDFEHVLAAISKQIYDTHLAFLRENVQNAIDAIRIQALRDGASPSDERYRVDVKVADQECTIRDNGIGMTQDDLRKFYWTIGASGKRTEEAREAGCVGMFGIGGFANLGVCDKLTVISQTEDISSGTSTSLCEEDIKAAVGSIPQVKSIPSNCAAPRGTTVIGHLRQAPDVDELDRYLRDFVKYAEERIYFNEKLISQQQFTDPTSAENLRQLTLSSIVWEEGGVKLQGKLFVDRGHTLIAMLTSLWVDSIEVRISGLLRFENGPIDVFKRGFKICATKIGTQIGVSGRIDCDHLSPTAGRDSLDSNSSALLGKVVSCMETVAVDMVLESSELIAQHTRIFPYILRRSLVDRLNKVIVRLADGSESTLGSLQVKGEKGVRIYYGKEQKQALSQIMQARGNLVVLLPADRHKQNAVKRFLESKCNARPFEGIVECQQVFSGLTRFEQIFLSQLEMNIAAAYDVQKVRLIPGKLTEDIPVFIADESKIGDLEIFVDVRHPEIMKLESLGFTPLLYSMVAAFCREYLGPSLRKRSPKFFGTGAVNLDWLAKNRSELWILLKDDIEVLSKGSQKQVMRGSDVHVVKVGERPEPDGQLPRKPKLLKVIGEKAFVDISGYYIRLPEGATKAYGDIIKECDSRGVVWAGNKILFVASDNISSAFQFEIRLDHLIVLTDEKGQQSVEGARELTQSLQALHEGLYFPIPTVLESILVPQGDMEIRIEIRCDWIDMKTAKTWQPSASSVA